MANTKAKKNADQESHADRFYEFLRTWGFAEAALDRAIALIYRHHNGRAVDHRMPLTLERKLNFVKAAVASQDSVAVYGDWAMKAHRRLTDEKDLRNTIVHGTPLKVERNGTVHIMRIEPNFESPRYRLMTVTPKDWERLWQAAADAFFYFSLFAIGLDPDKSDAELDRGEEASNERFAKAAAAFPGSKKLRGLLHALLVGRAS